MVGSSQVIGIQKGDGRFLGRRRDQGPFLEGKHYRAGRIQVQVFSVEMFQVHRSIAIHQMQIFKTQKHYRIAEKAGRGIIGAVGSLGVNTFRSAHHAAASPGAGRPTGAGEKFDGALRRVLQIQGREVRDGAAAAARSRGVNDSVDQIETPVARERSG